MLHPKTWLCVIASLLVLAGVFFVSQPRALAASGTALRGTTLLAKHADQAREQRAIHAGGLCSYSETKTFVIIDSNKWTNAAYFCSTGVLDHEIDQANDVYDNGGGPLWVKWSTDAQEHYCSISGIGAYWEFSKPVKILQIAYGTDHGNSYCP